MKFYILASALSAVGAVAASSASRDHLDVGLDQSPANILARNVRLAVTEMLRSRASFDTIHLAPIRRS